MSCSPKHSPPSRPIVQQATYPFRRSRKSRKSSARCGSTSNHGMKASRQSCSTPRKNRQRFANAAVAPVGSLPSRLFVARAAATPKATKSLRLNARRRRLFERKFRLMWRIVINATWPSASNFAVHANSGDDGNAFRRIAITWPVPSQPGRPAWTGGPSKNNYTRLRNSNFLGC